MKASDVKAFVYGTAGVVLLVLGLQVWLIDGWTFGSQTLRRIPTSITVACVFWLAFAKWWWRWKPFRLLFGRPALYGTWLGHLRTDYTEAVKGGRAEIPIVFVIRQGLFSIVVSSSTKGREGISDAAIIVRDSERDITRLSYLYSLRRAFKAGEGEQHGAAQLRHREGEKPTLHGEYWTNTKTQGLLTLAKVSPKVVTGFEEAKRRHPDATHWVGFG